MSRWFETFAAAAHRCHRLRYHLTRYYQAREQLELKQGLNPAQESVKRAAAARLVPLRKPNKVLTEEERTQYEIYLLEH